MMYHNTLSETASEVVAEKAFDQIEALSETFTTHEASEASELAVQVYLDKGASAEFQQKGGKIVVTADRTPAGPMARVLVKEGTVSWRRVNVHIRLKDDTRLMQTFEV
ncbi:hypothetical protein NX722_22050 [Endozoicomonas gorgoniicola]|uniref:Nuclear transport factor 2 family protein n=1 Tax=Endozoicomonas gorgoniicola TaxID=1234144 RepID=A0ABT3N0W1_9GAMM|nr:hypothetical protein [Endozoicomonas gorgoniicola]MCW7555259.1 hypothetical protein [Endozoicomonas gorgoniicola]